jgi:hypothetical protein
MVIPLARTNSAYKNKGNFAKADAGMKNRHPTVRFNPDLKAKYKDLLGAGKPPKLAITAIMRKLIIIADVLLRNNRTWTPQRT